jgi:putative ABC transport system permease protein
MLRITLAQMVRSLPRLVSAGLAVAIGTAFVAATLLAGGVLTRSGYDAINAQLGKADLVVDAKLDAHGLSALRALPQVAGADPLPELGVDLRSDGVSRYLRVLPVPTDPSLGTLRVVRGSAPSGADQIAIPVATATALHLAVGDTVDVPWTSTNADGTAQENRTDPVRVTGLVDDPNHAWTRVGDAGLVLPQDAARWNGYQDIASATSTYLVRLADGVTSSQGRAAITHLSPGSDVVTRDEAARRQLERNAGNAQILVAIVLAFAAVALVVAALVIANTFQVLVAQRTRTLALLRCIGAGTGQLRASVLLEAALLGLGSSVVGVVAGTGLAQAALVALRDRSPDVSLPSTVSVTAAVVLVPLAVGTLVTLAASLVPARAASRVAPIAALRPLELTTASVRTGGLRVVAVLLLTVGGALALALATVPTGLGPLVSLGVGVVAGAAATAGIVLGAVYWVPWCVRLVGRVLGRAGVAARLAVANTARNPRRTSATSAALLIGVTLVAMMATGAASARATTESELNAQYPVDLTVELPRTDDGATALPDGIAGVAAHVDGVAAVVPMRSAMLWITGDAVAVRAPVGGRLADVVRDRSALPKLADDVVVVPHSLGLRGGDVSVTPVDSSKAMVALGSPQPMTVKVTSLGGRTAVLSSEALERLAPGLPVSALWVRLDSGTDPNGVRDVLQADYPDVALDIQSPAAERARYAHVVDTMLAIVIGLLAVAVVIALIGVANTLSLSVLERRRESATLRALGLTRRRLRWSLGIEGMVIAGVGGVVGTVLGLVFGWAGVAVTFQTSAVLAVPWARLALIVLVALAAGLLASALPARSAARTPPVAALAVD